MLLRRKLVTTLACTVVALGIFVVPTLADELIGVITKVDLGGKKLTVLDRESGKEVKIECTGETEYVSKKGATRVDLEKLERNIEKSKESGKRGIRVRITHEGNVASVIRPLEIEDPVPPKKPNR